jgi:hypothetical protein
VNEPTFRDMLEPQIDIPEDGDGLLLAEFPSLLTNEALEVSLIAKLSDDIAIIDSTEDVVALHEVGMVQFTQRLYLPLQELLAGGVSY